MNRPRLLLLFVVALSASLAVLLFVANSNRASNPAAHSAAIDRTGGNTVRRATGSEPGLPGANELASAELTNDGLCTALGNANWTEPVVSTYEAERRTEAFQSSIRDATANLGVSQNAEHNRVAAMLEAEPSKRIAYLATAVRKSDNNAHVLWDAVRVCSTTSGEIHCPLADWEARLQALDGQNSEVWVRIAANRLREGDEEAALQAMQYAAASAESREYRVESFEAVERALSAAGNFTFPERVSLAFGAAASNLPNYQEYTSMCSDQPARDVQWAYVCLAYGELLERQGKTEIGQSIALALQKIALEFMGDAQKLAEVVARQGALRAERQQGMRTEQQLSEALLFVNPAVFYHYLAEVKALGETSARAYLHAEAERWLRLHGVPDCVS